MTGAGYLPEPEWALGSLTWIETPTTVADDVAARVEREIASLRRCGGPTVRGIDYARRLLAALPATAEGLLDRERADRFAWRRDLAYGLAVMAWTPEGAAWDGRTWREVTP